MNKIIISVVGEDRVGIIAKVTTYLAENSINTLDISQTIVDGYFNMLLIADSIKCEKPFETVADELKALGKSMNLMISTQQAGIFNAMHEI